MPNLSQTPDVFDQYLGLMQSQHELIESMKGFIVHKTPEDAGTFIDEYLTQGASPISFQLQIDRPARVTKILFSYTPVAAATLVIGPNSGNNRTINIPATITSLPVAIDCDMIVTPKDFFTLTCAGASTIYLEVMGRVLSGTDWSQT